MPLRFGINFKYRSKRGNDGRESSSTSSSKLPYEPISSTQKSEDEVSQASYLKIFSFNELKAATRNFRPDSILGEGGFGRVYKGWIDERQLTGTKPGTGMVVAVKVLDRDNSLQGQREWLAEITFLGQLQHPNIVKLIGYCLEDGHRLLVYEFMPRGSLENHLFRRASGLQPLSWAVRMKVALDAAKSLAFLHSDKTNVIHRDFKASNILLDSHYNAKLSSLDLAKEGPTGDMSHVSTSVVVGTYGYLAPEYIITGHLSRKCDVYSFGVVLLEILSGRQAIDRSRPLEEQNLVEWARHYISKKKIVRVLDPRIEGQCSLSKALKVANLAVQCLSIQPRSRPNMEEVVKTLEQLQSSNENEEPKESSRQNPKKIHGKSSIPSLVPESVPVSIPKTTESTDESEKTNFRLSAESGVQGANLNFTPRKDALTVPHMVTSFSENIDILPAGGTEMVAHETDGCSIALERRKIVKRSTVCIVEKILRSIGDVNSKTIGIHGLGGIGKTSILKALEDDPKTRGMFDIIISVTLSKSWSMRQIQDQVARKFSLGEGNFEADSEIGFFKTLQTKKFLLILDDVVKKINLNDLGIHPSSLADGSRLVFATRSQEVCHAMAEIIIEVKGLSFGEGWELFRELVGPITEFPDIQPYARGIVEQCCGSPLLLILTGKALTKENEIGAWESAFKEFLMPVKSGMSDTDFLNQKLQFIYKRLKAYGTKDHVMRSGCDLQGCFLYCALFPQDQVINIPKLLECWMQEGLITGNVIESCKKGHEIIKVLLDAALLESVEQGHSIKMHKVVRDFALELVLPEVEARRFLVTVDFSFMQPPNLGSSPFSGSFDQYLLKAGGGITKAPLDEEWEQAKMMFLMDNELSSLPERPKCRNLSGLFLQRNHCLKAIPVSFFNYMPYLQVLNLSNSAITCLPKSISNLKRLKELMMRDCERLVKLPSQLGGLQRLEVLDLHGTEIDKLPRNIEQLAFLTCLRVHFYGSVDHMEYLKLSPELFGKRTLSGLLFLKILSIVVMPGDPRWIKVAEVVTRDICKLRSLIDLSFYFPQVELIHLFVESSLSWRGNDLKKFNFVAGHDVKRMVSRVPYHVDFEYNQRGQRLRFVNGEEVSDVICEVLRRTTAFYLDHHLKVRSLSQFGVQNMTWLEVCVARECPELETIIDSEELAFPLLQLLSIHYLENLKSIWHGGLLPGSFASLKYLYVYTCRRLNFVLESSMTRYISNLEELVVVDCLAMTELIHEDMHNIVRPGDILLPRLKTLTLRHLPRLVCLWKGSWPSLEHISICYCPNLRSLNIELDTKLTSSIKEIKAEIDWWSNLGWKDTSLSQKLEACFVPLDDNEVLKI